MPGRHGARNQTTQRGFWVEIGNVLLEFDSVMLYSQTAHHGKNGGGYGKKAT